MCSNFGLQVKFCPSSIFLLRSLLIYDKMKNKDGLVEIYGQLVDLIGIENTEKIYYTLRGQQIVFPMRLYKTEFISKEVRRRYNGKNLKELANEYGYTERYLRSFIKNDGRNE